MRLLRAFFGKRKAAPAPCRLLPGQWLLLPLGNPGEEYACTRHNLGRLMVQRWMDKNCVGAVQAIRSFYYGTVYSLTDSMMALVPSTYMNLSGRAVSEAVADGLPKEQMLVIYDDKDLPLGTGRLSKNGGSGGHNGLQSVIDSLDGDAILRLRLGLGPFQRPLRDWVLEEWTPQEWEIIEKMDSPFSNFISMLADNLTVADLQSRVNAQGFWN